MEVSTVSAFRHVPTGLEGLPSVSNAKSESAKPPLTVTDSARPAAAAEIEVVPDEALARDDELGVLVSRAFDLPAAPMPDFSKMGDVV